MASLRHLGCLKAGGGLVVVVVVLARRGEARRGAGHTHTPYRGGADPTDQCHGGCVMGACCEVVV